MRPFISEFPILGEEETRMIHILEEGGDEFPPPDEYAFLELYCDEKACDCRRVLITVYARHAERIMATINMGFDVEGEEAGPFLDPLNPQTKHSSRFMGYFLKNINNDPEYMKRLQRHYVMFKEKVEGKPYNGKPFEWPEKVIRVMNDPDPLPLIQPATDEKDAEGLSFAKEDIRKARAFIEEVEGRLERGKANLLHDDTSKTLEENPKIAFALLHLMVTSHGAKNARKKRGVTYDAILILLEEALTQLRYSVEKKRPWAKDAADRIQNEIAEKAFQLAVDVRVQADLLEILYASKLKIHSAIRKKKDELADYYGRFTARNGPPDFKRLFDGLSEDSADNPFDLYEQMMVGLNGLPLEGQLFVILEMVRSGNPLMCEVAVLMLLHPDREIRIHIPAILDNALISRSITPNALRRMIGLRNWLPGKERTGLDSLIKAARLARIQCAPMPQVQAVEILASSFDGAGMQGIWGFSRKTRIYQMVSLLLKQGEGIREILINPEVEKGEKKSDLRRITGELNAFQVEANYLEKLIPHFLRVGQACDNPPLPGLLKTAELLVRQYWQPRVLDFEKEIAVLEDQLPASYRQRRGIQEVLEKSRDWPIQPFGTSWFEDDGRVDELVRKHVNLPFGNPEALSRTKSLIFREILEEKREVWGERMFWMALRSRSCIGRNRLPWAPFLIISRELMGGTPLKHIPLMDTVAEYSILSGLRRIKEFPE